MTVMHEPPLPRPPAGLRACGRELDLSPGAFGWFERHDPAAPPAKLRTFLATRGYLFLPGFLDRDAVAAGRAGMLRRLAAAGHLEPRTDAEEALPNPDNPAGFVPEMAQAESAVQSVLYGLRMMDFFGRLFGEPATHFDFTWFRATGRGPSTLPHCDIVYMGRGTFDLFTAWVPFSDIPLEMGGLAILEDSPQAAERLKKYLSRDVDEYSDMRLSEARDSFERKYIVQKLEENGYNISRTAQALGIYPSNLHGKIKKFGIEVHK